MPGLLRIFSEVTVLVKKWAGRRGIYNSNFGYFNGISIMILVARAMQSFFTKPVRSLMGAYALDLLECDYETVRQKLIDHFFMMYAEWPW